MFLKTGAALLSLLPLSVLGQYKYFSGFQSPNVDASVYTAMQNIWYANERPSYLSFLPVVNNQLSPSIPLREGEGKRNLHILEGNIYARIPIAMGRNHAHNFWQTSRLTFDAGFNIRMARDSSSPLIPNNNIFGFTVDKVLWNSVTHQDPKKDWPFIDWLNFKDPLNPTLSQPLHNLSLELGAHHYSNGQQPGFYLRDTVGGVARQRNDYRKGDFSTNYVRTGLTYSFLSRKRNLFSANLSYQWDGTFFGPLNYSEEQERTYGHHRLKGFLQYRLLVKRKTKSAKIADVCADDTTRRSLQYYRDIVIRWEPELILDDLSQTRIPDGKDHRFSQHFFLEYTQPNWRAFGLILHVYTGRDYSNIRYDMPVIAYMVGLAVHFNKYYPALSDEQRFADVLRIDKKRNTDENEE